MSVLSDHTVYCIIRTGQCQVFSFEWAFFSGPWMWRSYRIVTKHECDVLMSSNVQCDVLMSSNVQCDVLMSCEEWQTEFSDCSICFLFSSFDYLVRAARCWQPIVGGYLGAWIVLLNFSRRSRALHFLLWSIIWYWMSIKLTLRGEKRHVSLGNVYH